MSQNDNDLKVYADSGLRTAKDWTTLGRDIMEAAKASAEVSHRGTMVALYTRGQTRARPKSQRLRPAAAKNDGAGNGTAAVL